MHANATRSRLPRLATLLPNAGKGREELKRVQPPRGNSLVPSPIKTDEGAVISYRIARWKSLPEVIDGGRL